MEKKIDAGVTKCYIVKSDIILHTFVNINYKKF